jgi:hypothetical protein
MTGERETFWIYDHEPTPPAVHAGFRIRCIIVRSDEYHFHFALEPISRLCRDRARAFDLIASRQERGAVVQGPSKILRVRKLEATRRQLFGQCDDVRNLGDVVPV